MITPFNPSVIGRAIEVVRRSNADTVLLALLTPPSRGRRPTYNTTAFLVGSILAVQWKGSLVIRDIHRVLTERLPVDMQRELGVRTLDVHGHERLTTEKDLYAITEAVGKYLEYGAGSAPDLEDDEREQRRAALLDLLHSLLAVTLPESPSTSRDRWHGHLELRQGASQRTQGSAAARCERRAAPPRRRRRRTTSCRSCDRRGRFSGTSGQAVVGP